VPWHLFPEKPQSRGNPSARRGPGIPGVTWQGGFTLLELVMVLVILGILLALALPSYLSARRNAYFAEAAERLQEMREFAWSFYAEKQTFDGFLDGPYQSTANWDFSYSSCAGTSCLVVATGRPGTRVQGATVTVTLYGDGTSTVSSSGF
jgi:prepilin-type N-terminal cleavage/methylation domain-containing protein